MYKTQKDGATYAQTLKNHTKLISFMLILLINSFYAVSGYSQSTQTVKGKITDASNNGLPGVSIKVNGTSAGTISDLDGNYTLSLSQDAKFLTFSYIGMLTQEIRIENKKVINVSLVENSVNVDEIVVVGYGTQKKSDLTGSVAVVSVKDMKKISNSNMSTMLEGRIAGVSVSTDGQPGADPTVRIRGVGSFGDVSPLYVVDGVPVGTTIRDFSPNDIESMQVLKDASAAAIYGARAANGVIIITTKHGKEGTPLKVDFSGYFGVDNVPKTISVLNSSQYQTINNRSRVNNGSALWSANDPTSSDYISDVNTDWQKEALKTGTRQDYNLNFAGGGKSSTYNLSLDYYNSKGTLVGVGPDYKRYTIRATNTAEVGVFKFNSNVTYSHSDQNSLNSTDQSSFSGSNPPLIVKILAAIPTQKVYDSSTSTGYGTYNTATQGEMYSLNMVAMNNILKSSTNVDRILASGSAEIDFNKILNLRNQTLKYKLNVSWDKTYAKDLNWIPAFSLTDFYTNNVAKLDEGYRNYSTGLIENTLNYSGKFGLHKIDAMIGQSFQADNYNTVTGHAEGFTTPYYIELANGQTTTSSSYSNAHYLSSLMARLNYDYDDRYLLSGTIRRDGSSRFSKANRFGYFPSVSVGWKINHEKFFTVDEHTISDLKLRASWGVLGNENIGNYQYLQSVNRNYVYNFNNTVVYGSSESSVVDNNIKWESKRMANVGLDASFLDHAFDFTAEYYNSRSTDLLVNVTLPYSVGSIVTNPVVNAGTMENHGFEFTLTYHNHKNPFKFDISANGATLANKVISLGNNGQPIYGVGSISEEGKEVGRQYGYVYDGIFQSQAEVNAANALAVSKNGVGSVYQSSSTSAGDVKYKDLNGDGKITSADRTDLGSSIPHFSYGLNFSASYKNWDFSLFAHGVTKFLVIDNTYRTLMHTAGGLNWSTDILNSWTTTNTNTDIPRVVYVDGNDNDRNSNRPGWLQNGAYLRLSTISIGYTLPQHLTKSVFSLVRVYGTCQNVYTFTSYKGYNPDYAGSVWNPGYNAGSYPTPRTIMFGVNLSLK
jgi:TonB-dependent starch-binding outer membrane protein SusC